MDVDGWMGMGGWTGTGGWVNGQKHRCNDG